MRTASHSSPLGRVARAAVCALVAVALAFPPGSWALGPFERNHPAVERGMEAYREGRYEDALRAFEEAKKELPNSAVVEYDRGNALVKLGRLEEAKEAYNRVAELDRGDLRAKDLYNLGNVWAQLGGTKEAIAAYRKALTLDPTDAQARHNLEVLLRRLPPPKQSGQDGGTDGGQDAGTDGGRADAGSPDGGLPRDGGQDGGSDGGSDGGMDGGRGDGGVDGGRGDAGQGDGGSDGGPPQPRDERGDGGQSDQRDDQRDGGEGDEGTDGGTEEPEEVELDGGTPFDLNKKDAERLLDSMRQNEKNLQLWRFQQKKRSRKPNEKDW